MFEHGKKEPWNPSHGSYGTVWWNESLAQAVIKKAWTQILLRDVLFEYMDTLELEKVIQNTHIIHVLGLLWTHESPLG